jgi:hypothetical protein
MMKNIEQYVKMTEHGFRFNLNEETVANEAELKEYAGISNLYDEISKAKAEDILGKEEVGMQLDLLRAASVRAQKKEKREDFDASRKAAYEEVKKKVKTAQFNEMYPKEQGGITADDSILGSKSKRKEKSQSAEFHNYDDKDLENLEVVEMVESERLKQKLKQKPSAGLRDLLPDTTEDEPIADRGLNEVQDEVTDRELNVVGGKAPDLSEPLYMKVIFFFVNLIDKIASVFRGGSNPPNPPGGGKAKIGSAGLDSDSSHVPAQGAKDGPQKGVSRDNDSTNKKS